MCVCVCVCVCMCKVMKNIADKFSDIPWQLKIFMNYISTNFKNGNVNLFDMAKIQYFMWKEMYVNLCLINCTVIDYEF